MSATSPEGSVSRTGTSTRTGSGSGSDGSGQNGSYYASTGASNGASGSTSGASGASTADQGTALSRGAVTNRTAPTQRVGSGTSGQSGSSGSTGQAAAATGAGARATTAPRKHKGPRRVRLAVARVDPWSVMKMSFLLSVALGIAGVILTAVLWMILSTMNVFTDIEGVLQSLQTTTSDPFSIKDYVGFGRVVSLSIVIGVIDVILMTAIATVMAFLYNICSALVGGVQLTLTDD
ncbi:DUF3566 domain-containing protein [Terrabacter sp. C0L_2]|uniref:DUF3566 domain-containing protein n=1 Tax=Terrabacter sp. C0L_2 TaxID=3108389 RepID=UPI002ED69C58|nr:DUF3566 domain-containing protein [Terrabacter sp. C0L_2]